jgi:hypothetical protein
MKALALLLAAAPAFGAVEGAAINMTTGKPQPGVRVSLVQPGAEGMKTLGEATSGADGVWRIDQDLPRGGPALLQSAYLGVTYTQALPPGSASSGIRVNVYEATGKAPQGLRIQHLILLEPSATKLAVQEIFIAENESQLTFQDAANGTIRVLLPEGAPQDLRVTINATGVPIQRPLEKSRRPGEFKITYPIKPGETRFEFGYELPASASFTGKVVPGQAVTRLLTAGSVTLSGEGVVPLGQEPQTQARFYSFSGDSFTVNISGIGALRRPSLDVPAEESGAPKCCREVPPRLLNQMNWILGLSFAILAAGGALLYRRGRA